MNLHVHVHLPPEVTQALARIEASLSRLQLQGSLMANELERLTTEVSETNTAIDSAILLLEKLSQLIRDNAGDPAALAKLADDLDAKGQALAAAVVANTPAEEPPVEPPPA